MVDNKKTIKLCNHFGLLISTAFYLLCIFIIKWKHKSLISFKLYNPYGMLPGKWNSIKFYQSNYNRQSSYMCVEQYTKKKSCLKSYLKVWITRFGVLDHFRFSLNFWFYIPCNTLSLLCYEMLITHIPIFNCSLHSLCIHT